MTNDLTDELKFTIGFALLPLCADLIEHGKCDKIVKFHRNALVKQIRSFDQQHWMNFAKLRNETDQEFNIRKAESAQCQIDIQNGIMQFLKDNFLIKE